MRLLAQAPSQACRYLSTRSARVTSTALPSLTRTINHPTAHFTSSQRTSPHIRQFASSTTKMSSDAFLEAVISRRTYYALSDESPISDKKIHELVDATVKHVPSSFNSQSTRVVVLLGAEHKKLWGDIVIPAVKAVAPAEAWPASEKRLSGFKAGYGTILFYEEPKDVLKLQEQFPLYADKFPQWSEHTNAIHQYVLWIALEKEGFGVNLQHYNPLIDQKIAETWDVPQLWSLKGQLVFGKPTAEPNPKTFKPLEERVFIHGAKE